MSEKLYITRENVIDIVSTAYVIQDYSHLQVPTNAPNQFGLFKRSMDSMDSLELQQDLLRTMLADDDDDEQRTHNEYSIDRQVLAQIFSDLAANLTPNRDKDRSDTAVVDEFVKFTKNKRANSIDAGSRHRQSIAACDTLYNEINFHETLLDRRKASRSFESLRDIKNFPKII